MKLSAIYIVKNEEEFLAASLESVAPFVDELIIFDTKSTDGTEVICNSFQSKYPVIRYVKWTEDFRDKPEAYWRNLILKSVTGDWVLQVDGDEVLSDGWYAAAKPYMSGDYTYGFFKFCEHVGSVEFVKSIDQKKIRRLFKMDAGLKIHPYDPTGLHCGYHHEHLPTVPFVLEDATLHHMGYVKSNINEKMKWNCERGDWTNDEDRKRAICYRIDRDGGFAMIDRVIPYTGKIPTPLIGMVGQYSIALRDGFIVSRVAASKESPIEPPRA